MNFLEELEKLKIQAQGAKDDLGFGLSEGMPVTPEDRRDALWESETLKESQSYPVLSQRWQPSQALMSLCISKPFIRMPHCQESVHTATSSLSRERYLMICTSTLFSCWIFSWV